MQTLARSRPDEQCLRPRVADPLSYERGTGADA
jgi:hypothetical protein